MTLPLMNMSKSVYLILAGSFNPVTIAHLRMLELAREHVVEKLGGKVEKAIISPVGDFYPEKKLVSASLRIQMLRAAVSGQEWIEVDDWESKEKQWTRTRDLLSHYQQRFGPQSAVIYVAGTDLIHSFAKPGLWQDEHIREILTQHGILVVKRAGSEDISGVHPVLREEEAARGLTTLEEWMPNGISSTLLRQALKEGKSIKYWTPDAVIDIIKSHGLYQ